MEAGTRPQPLTADQVAFFEREGYLVIENVLTDDEIQPVLDEIAEKIDVRARALVEQGKLSRLYDEYDFEHRLVKITEETEGVGAAIRAGQLSGPAIFNLIRNPKLLDIAEQFCGPELIGSSLYRLRPKVPNSPLSAVPWHQDAGYAHSFCDQHLMLTYWIAFVDATEENGCMWVYPRSNKLGILTHARRDRDRPFLVVPEQCRPPDRKPVCVPVRKGGVLLMTNLTPHASFENRTDTVRWSMDVRYQSAALPTNAPIRRLEGEIDSSGDDNIPPACHPPEADFLLRSRARPDQVVTGPAEFHRIREEHMGSHFDSRDRWSMVVDG